jgi:predicted nucleotidyltransferase
MIPLIDQQLDAIRAACRRHGVAKLAVFGSALEPKAFDLGRSDIDFIVSFRRGRELGPWLAEYPDLRTELGDLLGRPIDLVMEGPSHDLVFNGHSPRVIYADPTAQVA